MKIGFYNPYFDGFGGGERYTLTLASHWSRAHDVTLFWDDPTIVKKSQDRFGLDLSNVTVVPNVFSKKNVLQKVMVSVGYDLIFFLSDGSVPLSFAKHNILHFQVPFGVVKTTPFHLARMNTVICNSLFTKNNLDATLSQKASVIYPPTDTIPVTKLAKEKIILSVGRFTAYHTAKKQDEMIRAFIAMESKCNGWRLILAGGLLESDRAYYQTLVDSAKGHAIDILPNISHAQIIDLYQKASVYWHAAGLGETDPRFMEHFGISTVEAMSAGAVPVVYKGGGQIEIVKENENGVLFTTMRECMDKTLELIGDKARMSTLKANALHIPNRYSTSAFTDAFDQLLHTYSYIS